MNKLLAESELLRLVGLACGATPAPVATVSSGPRTVSAAVADYLVFCDGRQRAGKLGVRSLRNYRITLAAFVDDLGVRSLASLTAEVVEQWAERPSWSDSTRHNALGVVQSVLKREGISLRIRRPAKESRAAECVLDEDQFREVLGNIYGDLGPLLQLLRETGARPCELVWVTAEGVDWKNSLIRLRMHKSRRYTGSDRVIHLNAAAVAIITAQRDRHPSGPLFRTRCGNAWTPNGIVKRLLVVSEWVGFRVTAYGLGRHSFATHALTNGVPDVLVAGLLGHSGPGMVHRHYSHISEQGRALKDAAERARAG